MSDDPHYQATEDAHTGPIKNPKQLLLAVFFSFIAPILIIAGLVSYVVSGTHPSGAAAGRQHVALRRVEGSARPRDRRAPEEGRLDRDPRRQPAARRRRSRVQGPVRGLPRRARASRARRTSTTPRPGARASARATPRCSSMRSRARARCRRRAAATSKTSRSAVPWSTWPIRAAPSSRCPTVPAAAAPRGRGVRRRRCRRPQQRAGK